MSLFADRFAKEIEDDLVWREAELAVMRKQLVLAPTGSLQETVLLRASLAMIYAHYEGFCKFGLELYITALERLKLKRQHLQWRLATYSLGNFHNQLLKQKDRTKFFSMFMNEFDSQLDEFATYERPPQIANLWPDLLVEWLTKLDLDAVTVSRESTSLHSLVTNRNLVAHGKKLIVANRTELEKYSHSATLAMHEVAIGIVDALQHRSYLRYGEVRTILGHAV